MSVSYLLLGRPKNLGEFLDRARRLGKKDIILEYRHWMIMEDEWSTTGDMYGKIDLMYKDGSMRTEVCSQDNAIDMVEWDPSMRRAISRLEAAVNHLGRKLCESGYNLEIRDVTFEEKK